MLIEVTGVNTWNKGAELMLVAIRERLQHRTGVRLVVDPWFGSYEERARHGLWLRPEMRKVGRSRAALGLMPPSFRQQVGVVLQDELDAVLDASGFAFGDQHPPRRAEAFADRVEQERAAGRPVVLLPQALGPFETPRAAEAFRRIATAATLTFARDEASLAYARAAAPGARIEMAPDFTNLVKPERTSAAPHLAWIVPNHRMIEKAQTKAEAEAYLPLLARCIRLARERGFTPRVLIHGRDDEQLLAPLAEAAGEALDHVLLEDAVDIKRALGDAGLVVASRFHALASALSQAVPAIATSWSHKYEMLFRDYGCGELVLPVPAAPERVQSAFDSALAPALPEQLRRAGAELESRTEQMWAQAERALGLPA
jgi:colanic acid/amylovoran biosynthesis protein